jgi:glutathione S-transferase
MPVRWAFEEVGQPYEVRLVSFDDLKAPAHLALQPFGQLPTYQQGDLALFESAAIVLHTAEHHQGLLPGDANARARAKAWMLAAVATVEPVIVQRESTAFTEHDKPWYAERLPLVEAPIRTRLQQLEAHLGDGDWLDGDFSAGDLLMVQVLRRLGGSGLLDGHPQLAGYIARAEARPAFQRAFAAQRAVFAGQPY